MKVYAGIDEAGYGPMFGPFVIARSVFVLNDDDAIAPPDLWQKLDTALCRSTRDKKRRIAVNDSKKLHTKAAGLKHLERGVLSFLRLTNQQPHSLTELLNIIGHDEQSRQSKLPWYNSMQAPLSLPSCQDAGALGIAASLLNRAADTANIQLANLSAAVVYEDRYNHIVNATHSKARCAWMFVAQHLAHIFQQFGQHNPYIVVDRQGGRQHYRNQLQLSFADAAIRILEESPARSRYELTQNNHRMTISFEVDSEQANLPVALASMTAKYCRELLMQQFNHFWIQHLPDLKRTAGYVQDGRRFLKEIEPTFEKLNINRDLLIRVK